ncbi:MAG: GNAT family N-acetyltransferase [Bacteroidales bacterium]|nr:GNAT family N-acetyltransferase [Bacteroidales bacterium]
MKEAEDFGGRYLIHQMEPEEVVSHFDCGDANLNDFLIRDSTDFREELMAVTYVMAANDDPDKIIGFCSLANDHVALSDFADRNLYNRFNRKHKIPNNKRLETYPAVKVCRIGIDRSMRQRGAGTKLLDFVKSIFTFYPNAGCRFVTVDAYKNAIPFYEKNGFRQLPVKDDVEKRTQPLYFDLKGLL